MGWDGWMDGIGYLRVGYDTEKVNNFNLTKTSTFQVRWTERVFIHGLLFQLALQLLMLVPTWEERDLPFKTFNKKNKHWKLIRTISTPHFTFGLMKYFDFLRSIWMMIRHWQCHRLFICSELQSITVRGASFSNLDTRINRNRPALMICSAEKTYNFPTGAKFGQ